MSDLAMTKCPTEGCTRITFVEGNHCIQHDPRPNWKGVHHKDEHRTVGGHRAMCNRCNMWCGNNITQDGTEYDPGENELWCHCCLESDGYEFHWTKVGEGFEGWKRESS